MLGTHLRNVFELYCFFSHVQDRDVSKGTGNKAVNKFGGSDGKLGCAVQNVDAVVTHSLAPYMDGLLNHPLK